MGCDVIKGTSNYHIEVHGDLDGVQAPEWDSLLASQPEPTPFMRHAFIQALLASGCASPDTGWTLRLLVLRDASGQLLGLAPTWSKTHSWGEYVFDWAWAQAYQRHGLRYYPKLVSAAPFSPVQGARLLARDAEARAALLDGLVRLAQAESASSVHLLFAHAGELEAARDAGWLIRSGVQFHWQNRPTAPWPDFQTYLGDLKRDKRKKIQQERRKVIEAGVCFDTLEGAQISDADWDYFYRCHTLTYQAHGGVPYLSRDFFARVAESLRPHWLMFVARQGGRRVGVSLLAIDRTQGVAWGRYWGATESIACLHFEACYYQPLAWCIAQGFRRFEGGAQGAHKMARGLLPTPTGSAHWLAHPGFSEAVQHFLTQEDAHLGAQFDELQERSPFKPATDETST